MSCKKTDRQTQHKSRRRFAWRRWAGLYLASVLSLVPARMAAAQTTDDVKTLKKLVNDLEQDQKELRKEVEALRTALSSKEAISPSNIELSLDGSSFMGERTAKVTLVEFFDYQCPFCYFDFSRMIPRLSAHYIRSGKVKYVVRDFQIHSEAVVAAEAAHCAGDQGKFWVMHDNMMANPQGLDRQKLSLYAQNFGLDQSRFDVCVDSSKYAQEVKDEMTSGLEAGVDGTPTIFLGTTSEDGKKFKAVQMFRGLVPVERIEQAVDHLLADTSVPSSPASIRSKTD